MAVTPTHIPTEILRLLTAQEAAEYRLVPFAREAGRIRCYGETGHDYTAAAEELEVLYGWQVEVVPIAADDLQRLLLQHYRPGAQTASAAAGRTAEIGQGRQFLFALVGEALRDNASDIHLEPYEQRCRIRMRIDGKLAERYVVERAQYMPLVNQIKILASLDISEKRLPQDGRIAISLGGRQAGLRVSTLPTSFGERVVLRLLEKSERVLSLTELGLSREDLQLMHSLVGITHGIVLVTGPTGSGKTTTLYMVLQEVAQRQVNVSTIEDPVERNLDRINQTQVNNVAGLTFESGLRALLRQDPDVIMVGETRDAETASISVRAAITGHMVFSTLHTNDALSSIVRLEDMGVERYMIANSLAGVVAQRLMRRVCPACARKVPVTEAEAELLGPSIPFVARGTGCPQCNGTGYKGRVAIHEMVVINKALRRMIAEGASIEEMTDAARKTQGMRSLRESAVQLVRDGVTTPEELLKITYFEE